MLPPPNGISIPIVHKIIQLYKEIYQFGKSIQKRDRFGIWLKIENTCLECLNLSIKAALSAKENKLAILEEARIKIEVLKQMIRLSKEIEVINNKKYILLEKQLQEISKMTTGWLKYLSK